MTVSVQSHQYPGARLVLLAEDEPVGVTAVQQTLTALWRLASEQSQEAGAGGLARACLWNLVVFHSNPTRRRGDAGSAGYRIQALMEQVTAAVPARVIHLEEWRNEAAPGPGKEIEAWVSTHCLEPGAGPRMVCCEQIDLAGYGERGHSHFPALVRALLVPDLPTGVLWLDEVPRKGRVLGQLLAMCDRVIVDTQRAGEPDSLLGLVDLQRSAAAKLADLGWLRLIPLRHLVADFFDPPGRAEQLGQLERILVEVSSHGRNTGVLLLGWLLSRCGLREVRAVEQAKPEAHLRWRAPRKGRRPVEVELVAHGEAGGMDGVVCIQIEAGGDTFALHDVDDEHMSVQGPDRTLPRVALRETDEPGLVALALSTRLPDRVHAEALDLAAALVECQQWNR